MGFDLGMIGAGLLIGGIISFLGISTDDVAFVIGGIIFGAFFAAVGIMRIYFGHKRKQEIKTGTVVGYETGNDGRVILVIQAEGNTYRASSTAYNWTNFPIGASVTFNMLGEVLR